MNKLVKLQIFIFPLVVAYFAVRFFSATQTPSSLWVFFFRDYILRFSFSLIGTAIISYLIFNTLRNNPIKGPTIVKGSKLKTRLYIIFLTWWLAVISWMFADAIKTIIPLNQLNFYRFADFIDETLGHIFMYISIITFLFTGLLLEIERPFVKSLKKLETVFVVILSLLTGTLWGLNLTEGRLSLITSLPLMMIFLLLSVYLFKKHRLSLSHRPWSLSSLIIFLSGSVSFTTWIILFSSSAELFSTIK